MSHLDETMEELNDALVKLAQYHRELTGDTKKDSALLLAHITEEAQRAADLASIARDLVMEEEGGE